MATPTSSSAFLEGTPSIGCCWYFISLDLLYLLRFKALPDEEEVKGEHSPDFGFFKVSLLFLIKTALRPSNPMLFIYLFLDSQYITKIC